jgi:hypothetical protein
MFTSNQVLEISGSLSDKEDLQAALEFAWMYSGHLEAKNKDGEGHKMLYQITEDGRYCIGYGYSDMIPKGWSEFPFEFDIAKVCDEIRQHLEKDSVEYGDLCGLHLGGFLMKCINESLHSENDGIKGPFYGIVYFKPFSCYYSK